MRRIRFSVAALVLSVFAFAVLMKLYLISAERSRAGLRSAMSFAVSHFKHSGWPPVVKMHAYYEGGTRVVVANDAAHYETVMTIDLIGKPTILSRLQGPYPSGVGGNVVGEQGGKSDTQGLTWEGTDFNADHLKEQRRIFANYLNRRRSASGTESGGRKRGRN
jgi:hypothetical protein